MTYLSGEGGGGEGGENILARIHEHGSPSSYLSENL